MITGPVHYEAILALFVLMPAILLVLVWSVRRTPWKRVSGWLALAVLFTCLAFVAGWSLVERRLWDDVIFVMAAYGAIAAAACWGLLLAIQRLRRPLHGPYCPGCSYCLVGLTADRCPECGRAFTLEELGITREELRPTGSDPRHG